MTASVASSLANGRYELRGVLGAGGMATVYRAFDTTLGVDRAIKVLATGLTERTSIRTRFINEARTMAYLHHPNIVTIHDVVQEKDGSVYMVMELVARGSLMDIMKQSGPMPPKLASAILQSILAGLEVAHLKGVVHRDLKPHNILVTASGIPKITDFGIAHDRDSLSNTRTGTVMGTLAYMAPEQKSSATHVDARSDIYSIGATLYTLLTMGEPHHIFAQEVSDELLKALTPELAGFIRRSTRYKPEERFQTVREMLLELRAIHPRLPEHSAEWAGLDPAAVAGTSGFSEHSVPPREPRASRPDIDPSLAATLLGAAPTITGNTIDSSLDPDRGGHRESTGDPFSGSTNIGFLDSTEGAIPPQIVRLAAAQVDAPKVPEPATPFTIGTTEEDSPTRGTPLRSMATVGIASALFGAILVVGTAMWIYRAPAPTPLPPLEPRVVAEPVAVEPMEDPAPAEPIVDVIAEVPEPKAPTSSKPATAPKPVTLVTKPSVVAVPVPTETTPSLARLGINSVPWSLVRIDGVDRGRVGTKFEVDAGSHRIELTTADGRKQVKTLEVGADGYSVWCWDFDKGTECLR